MADISFERKRALSRQEAAVWLSALAKGFSHGDEVEVELEFTWRLTPPAP